MLLDFSRQKEASVWCFFDNKMNELTPGQRKILEGSKFEEVWQIFHNQVAPTGAQIQGLFWNGTAAL